MGYLQGCPGSLFRLPGYVGPQTVQWAGRAAARAPYPSSTVGCALRLLPFSARLPGWAGLEAANLLPCQGEAVKRVATARLETPIRQNCQPRPPATGNDRQRPGWDPRSGATVSKSWALGCCKPRPLHCSDPADPPGIAPRRAPSGALGKVLQYWGNWMSTSGFL